MPVNWPTRNADGFDLALHPVEHIKPSPAFLHAGFKAAEPAEVRALMDRMEADGTTIVERDEAAHTAFKCFDPDGHQIEVYWEPPFSR
jgi:catechol 2,3-dioxygenase-like lactoylglutathione lyase family enzyme